MQTIYLYGFFFFLTFTIIYFKLYFILSTLHEIYLLKIFKRIKKKEKKNNNYMHKALEKRQSKTRKKRESESINSSKRHSFNANTNLTKFCRFFCVYVFFKREFKNIYIAVECQKSTPILRCKQ